MDRIQSKRPVVANADAHDQKGRFKPGHKVYSRKHRGDKVTHDLKTAILQAAVSVGEDGKGKNGLEGYCRMLATRFPKNFTYILGKLLPLTVRDGIVAIGPVTVHVSPVPSGKFLPAMSGSDIVIDGSAVELVPEDEQDGVIPRKGPLPH